MARSINLIVVHCSATANADGLYRPAKGKLEERTALDVIDGWHAERGFHRSGPSAEHWNPRHQHIGYHHVIACDGKTFIGRAPEEVGAHAAGYNAHSIGICMTGMSAYTQAQWDRLAELLRWLSTTHRIALRPPVRVGGVLRDGVCGHRDLSPDKDGDGQVEPFEWLKTCPGFDVAEYLARDLQPDPKHVLPEVDA